ncbi:MAG: methionyl-tRNA formyltransferase [Acidobacteria bacterium]|nr:methionyl-tRNA formyltransferase [Acidobacteriota bacterium]MBV9188627.1 methionyl-tRNA formyltransferase [Acidobacteriota bacterium]
MRLVFFGTPEFAVPTLEALAREHEIALVVAQPDKPAGRGMKMQAPAVAVKARDMGLPLAQPPRIRNDEFLASVAALNPDAGIVVAYGKILPANLLTIPRYGFINVHASILPKYRGAAPIQRAIEHGETKTGVTIMRVDEELDHGAMLAIETTEIPPDERTPSLASRLSRIGAEALLRVLETMPDGTPQDHDAATYAPKIEKSEGAIHWSDTTASIYNKFRAFDPWPGIFAGELKLIDIVPADGHGAPGTILNANNDGVVVATGDGALRLITVQRPGKPKAAAADVLRGLGRL